jgi:hypothetical protein
MKVNSLASMVRSWVEAGIIKFTKIVEKLTYMAAGKKLKFQRTK